MKRLASLIAAMWMATTGIATAGEVVVVELFTSQGCSSCPPADTILGELTKRDDVIPLALHVDYWDYLGWKDEFANPAHTKRQRAYSRAAGERTIYTPQMVIGGQDHVIGSRPMEIARMLQKHSEKPKPVRVVLERSGDKVIIRAASKAAISPAVVQLMTYTPEAKVRIKRGENAGKTIDYHNVVRDLVRVANWDGKSDYKGAASVPSGVPVVVLIQERDGGVILGAARLR